jgi:hypothetical protein
MKRFKIFVGRDHYNNRPLYQVIDKVGDYVGEFHKSRKDAQKELKDLMRSVRKNPMKKKTRKKKVVRRKRRSRKSMAEKRVMRIKRGLMKRAKKLRLGAERTGAYVYGTLRRIVGNPYITKMDKGFEIVRVLYGYAKNDMQLLGTGLKISKGDLVLLTPATNIPGGGYFARPGYPTGLWKQVSEDASIYIRPSDFKNEITFKKPVFGSKSFERMIRGNPAIPASMNNPDYVKARRKAEQISKQYKRPYAIYASERNGKWVFRVAKYGLSFGDELVDIFNSQLVRKNTIRSSFDKPTFGPFNTETRRVDTTTMAGMKEEERLQRAGWYQAQATPFSTTYYRRKIRKNPPMYAHGMTAHQTHGLSLKQMMKLYRLVSSGNSKAVMFARRTLGIPMSESLSQVKAVVYHHVLDLKGKI